MRGAFDVRRLHQDPDRSLMPGMSHWLTRDEALERASLELQTPEGLRRFDANGRALDMSRAPAVQMLPLVSPSGRYAIDRSRCDELDLSEIVDLDAGAVIGSVPRSMGRYRWVDDEHIVCVTPAHAFVVDRSGATLRDATAREADVSVCDARGRRIEVLASGRIGLDEGVGMRPITNGPADEHPVPHPAWHWVAFVRDRHVWITDHASEWLVAPGWLPRWLTPLDWSADPRATLVRERRFALERGHVRYDPGKPREPRELPVPPTAERARELLAQLAEGATLVSWAEDADLTPRFEALHEGNTLVREAELALEAAHDDVLATLTGDGDAAIAGHARRLLACRTTPSRVAIR